MRTSIALLGLAALASSAAAQDQPEAAAKGQAAPPAVSHDLRTNVVARTAQAAAAAEIAAIEQAWGDAFMKRDRAYLEALLAPEFKLMRAQGGQALFTPRARWLDNFESYIFHDFQVQTIDVVQSGDTAVATVTGRWKTGFRGREGIREEGFIVSDTFVRRGGRWQAIYRHSSPHPLPAAVDGTERGG